MCSCAEFNFSKQKWKYNLIQTILGLLFQYIITATSGIFPFPMSFLIMTIAVVPVVFVIMNIDFFGLEALRNDNYFLLKRTLINLVNCSLPILFCVIFMFYRSIFARLSAENQILFAPMLPIIKIAFKNLVAMLNRIGQNPDFSIMTNYAFDTWASLCGVSLFFCKIPHLFETYAL